ncbi:MULTISPECIES: PRC-barrel domain-containing protein [unclassified Streptomyces]|uniref:PRC-barrel domain-containing protein n=1 Tax=unclassified Streptomyces TaxID=2593676 RepID=UPI00403D141D
MKKVHAADIREWRNRDVIDSEGRRIGVLESVYVNTATDESAMATVRIGLPTRQRLAFVPLDDAILGPGYVKVVYPKAQVKKAPSIGTDDILPAEEEEAIFQHYGMDYRPGAGGERRLARR